MTAPRPVMTARRARSDEGTITPSWWRAREAMGGQDCSEATKPACPAPGEGRDDAPEGCPAKGPAAGASASVPALEDDRRVVAPEADAVRQRVADRALDNLGRHPDVGVRVCLTEVDGRRGGLLGNGHDRGEGLERARRTHHVAGHRLGGGDEQRLAAACGPLAEHGPDGVGLALVPDRGGRCLLYASDAA